jgi:hypothetical protein
LRILLPLASVLLLAGCTDAEWAHVITYGDGAKALNYPEDTAAANYAAYAAGRPSAAGQKCARVAQERSDDSANQGFDADVQLQVHDRTYADCMTWAARTIK